MGAQPQADRGDPGALWHATWIQAGQGETEPEALWRGLRTLRGEDGERARRLAVHVLWSMPGTVTFTFAAVDDQQEIADAIGQVFDVLLMCARPVGRAFGEELQAALDRWHQQADALPGRVQLGSALALAEPDMPFRVLAP